MAMAEFTLGERIELLVEGELSQEQRKELVRELDLDATRWREVAFAFMEQRKICVAVRDVISRDRLASRQTNALRQQPQPAQKPKPPSNRAIASLLRITALAAVFLAVFSLGLASGRRNVSRVATTSTPGLTNSRDTTPIVAPRIRDPQGIVGYVHWESRVGVRLLPVFDGSASEQWLAENPPQIDERFERLLARSGWQVRPARRLVSMQFESGDTFTIPIDDLTYQYVGQKVF